MQTLRNHYLQTMGIQVWKSREILPGAKPEILAAVNLEGTAESQLGVEENTVQIEADELDTPLVPILTDSFTSSPPDSGEKTADVPLASTTASTPEESSLEAQPEMAPQQSSKASQTSNPEFRIASIVFPGACVVVTQVPVQAATPIATEHLAFLRELLFAIKAPIVGEPLVTLFNWPMLRSSDFDQSAAAAREASQAFLRGQKTKHSVGFVLLMGDIPGEYLLSDKGSFADKTGRMYESHELPRLLTHSVEQVFAEPQLKAQVWHDIQPLVTWIQQQQ